MDHARGRGRLIGIVVLGALLVRILVTRDAAAQLAPTVRDRVVPAAIEIALMTDVTENGQSTHVPLPVGSGTIVSPDGLALTAWHVVDPDANRGSLDRLVADAKAQGTDLTIGLDPARVLLLASDGVTRAVPAWIATVAAHDATLDLAALRVVTDARGQALAPATALPFVPLGNSATVGLGDPIHVFGYPRVGEDDLTYTAGVVSGFGHETGVPDPAWIMTDATLSGGSSGGTAVDAAGRLIGVPTQGSFLDCRPGDTNGDGQIDAQDVGCVPIGGSIGQLRPINLARSLLAQAGFAEQQTTPAPVPTVTPTAVPHAIGDDFRTPNSFDPPAPTIIAESTQAARTAVAKAIGVMVVSTRAARATEAACAHGPLYSVGVEVVVSTDDAPVRQGVAIIDQYGNVYQPEIQDLPVLGRLPVGTRLQIAGPYEEMGACDLWPVKLLDPPPHELEQRLGSDPAAMPMLLIDERDIRLAP